MKVQKFNEQIKIVNSSDMENWSGEKPITYSGSKKINYELGSEVIDLLAEYELGIVSVFPGKWLHGQELILPDETNFKEYRVKLGKKQSWNDFLENYNDENDTETEYDDLSEDEQEKILDIYNELPYEVNDDEIEFSVFLPNNIKNIESAAMSDASTYLKLLKNSNLDAILNGHCEYQIFFDYTKEVSNFINNKKIVITNKNLEDIKTVSYRLYKDSKVFTSIEDNIGESETKQLINDWLNLIK